MNRVARALVVHEFRERTRDRWVLVVSVLFAALASAVSAYGQGASPDHGAETLTGPSLVTLCSLFVPLVALVLSHDAIVGERERNTLGLLLSLPISRIEVVFAKLVGRGSALVVAVSLGIAGAMAFTTTAERTTLAALILPTLLLGLSFLALGVLLSSVTRRQAIAASLVVVTWFGLVFFYDLGLLALIVFSDGSLSQQTVSYFLIGNPVGLYRIAMMNALVGPGTLSDLGVVVEMPSSSVRATIWTAWILGPAFLSGAILKSERVVR